MTLGQLLKNKRLELGRSLEQISAATKIHTKILNALEEDQYADLPARTFTRGFLVTYTKALKLESEQVLKEYHDFLESKFAERHDRDKGHQGYVFEGKELEQNKRWVTVGTTIAILFVLAVFLIFKPQNHHRNEKHKEFTEEETAASSDAPEADIATPVLTTAENSTAKPTASASANSSSVKATPTSSASILTSSAAKPSASPVASVAAAIAAATAAPQATAKPSATVAAVSAAAPSATPATAIADASASPTATPKEDKLNKGDDLVSKDVKRKVTFQATDDVWVRYQVDQKPVMMIILRKGRQLVVKAKDQIRVDTNNSSALHYKTKGQYVDLDQTQFTVEGDGSLKTAPAALAPTAIPDSIPTSPTP